MQSSLNLLFLVAAVALQLFAAVSIFRYDALLDRVAPREAGPLAYVTRFVRDAGYVIAATFMVAHAVSGLDVYATSVFLAGLILSGLMAAFAALCYTRLSRGSQTQWRPQRTSGGGSGCVNPV